MKEKETFFTADRSVWRMWLEENHNTKKEIWFVFPTKNAEEQGVSYNDAVEEALCFGWIDSTTGKLDDSHTVRRFSPRKDEGYYSRINIERLIWLNNHDMLSPLIKDKVLPMITSEYVYPEDIMSAIKADQVAWSNFQCFSDAYKRIRISHIDSARNNKAEFENRLKMFISKTRENKLIKGFGFVEKYYK